MRNENIVALLFCFSVCSLLIMLGILLSNNTILSELKLVESIIKTVEKDKNTNALITGEYKNIIKVNAAGVTTTYSLEKYRSIKKINIRDLKDYSYEMISDCDENLIFNSNIDRYCVVFFKVKNN